MVLIYNYIREMFINNFLDMQIFCCEMFVGVEKYFHLCDMKME